MVEPTVKKAMKCFVKYMHSLITDALKGEFSGAFNISKGSNAASKSRGQSQKKNTPLQNWELLLASSGNSFAPLIAIAHI